MKPSFLFFPRHLDDAKISILGAPYDLNSSRRYGSRFAPDAVRKESLDMETNYLGKELSGLPVEDLGDIDYRGWNDFSSKLRKEISGIIEKNSIPLVIGGDHSITPDIVRALGRKDIKILAIDAHLDFDKELNGNTRSHSTPRRREAEMIGAENIYVIGARSWPTESMEDAREMGLNVITSIDVMRKGIEKFTKT